MKDKFLALRHVKFDDYEQLAGLYDELNSCNGSRDKVHSIIKSSRESLNKNNPFESLTFIAEVKNKTDGSSFAHAGTGRIMKYIYNPDEKIQMYTESSDLGSYQLSELQDNYMELGGLVVNKDFRGYSIGKSLTLFRALIARQFSGIIGADKIFVEFLPPYNTKEGNSNAFWDDLIYPILKENNKLDEAIKMASDFLGISITNEAELFEALSVKLSTKNRNLIVSSVFPKIIEFDRLTPEVVDTMSRVGQTTIGAKKNIENCYNGLTNLEGYFPIDGGQNITADVDFGGIGERIVQSSIYTSTDSTNKSNEFALVFKPHDRTMDSLIDFRAVACNGIFRNDMAKIPRFAAEELGINDGDYIAYRKIVHFRK